MNHSQKFSKNNNLQDDADEDILFPNIYAENGFIYKINPDGNDYKVARDISVDAVKENLDTNQVTLSLSTIYRGEAKTAEISRSDLRKRELLKLLKYGFDVLEINATPIIQHIHNQEHTCPKELIHSQVGFGMYQDTPIFKHNNAIGMW